jgi:protein-disulfide isomerase
MSKAAIFGIAGALVSALMFALGYSAGNTPNAGAGPIAAQTAPARSEIEAVVRSYLIENPQILMEMQASLEMQQEEQQRVSQVETIQSASAEIFSADYDGIIGNPEGSVTIVEFFDYNCGFCKRAMADMDAVVKTDDDVRFVLKEFPILGPDSQRAHVVSMAFRKLAPQNYSNFHRALMNAGRATEASAIDIALQMGVDEAALRAEMQNPDISRAFARTYELANRLAITGTPSYVIGDEVVFGALGQAVLEEKVALVRAE